MFFMKPKPECTREDVANAQQDADCVIIDCRTPGEAAGGTVHGAIVHDWMGGAFSPKRAALTSPKPTISIAAAATAADKPLLF